MILRRRNLPSSQVVNRGCPTGAESSSRVRVVCRRFIWIATLQVFEDWHLDPDALVHARPGGELRTTFLGSIGGFIVLFIGAVVLFLGYELFMAWLGES